ncbi:MAG: methylenetetrahydrofolate reductase [NAD(P)H] [Pseudomonadota bacterium]
MPTPKISFEFFPPKSLEASFKLWDTLAVLAPFQPEFVSVTYGAGGTTRALTHEAVKAIGGHFGLRVAAHLTCVDATAPETLSIAQSYAEAGVRDLVALRGDAPKGRSFEAHPGGFQSSIELVEALAKTGQYNIRVGAYPDLHPDSASMVDNVAWLKRKIDAGATAAITQFFFDAETFLRFRDACGRAGISAPIIPGILPVENWPAVYRFAQRARVEVPNALRQAFKTAMRDDRARLFATVQATSLCTTLIDEGVDHLHFYTLNAPDLTRDVCAALGIARQISLSEVA